MGIKCPKCGIENDAAAVSCGMCSTPFQAAVKKLPVSARPKPPAKYPIALVMAELFFGGLILAFLPLFLFHSLNEKMGVYTGIAAFGIFILIIRGFRESIRGAAKYAGAAVASAAGIGIAMVFYGFCISDWSYSFFSAEPKPLVNMNLLGDECGYTGFSIRPPAGWAEITDRPNAKIVFQDSREFNGFYPFVYVGSQKIGGSLLRDAMFSTGERSLREIMPDCTFIEKSICTVNGKNSCRLVVSYRQDAVFMKAMFVLIDYGEEKWCILGAAPQEHYDEYRDIFYSCASSLKTF